MTHAGPSAQLDAAELSRDLHTRRVGRQVIVLPEADSTNTYVLDDLAVQQGSAADGAAVFAEFQTAGRGRLGRTWYSPRGAGLTFTVLLCEDQSRLSASQLALAASIAVAAGVERATLVQPTIRWPNDIYVGPRKLGGILVETRRITPPLHATAVGIGVNCLQHAVHFPPDIRARATSLELEAPHAVDRTAVARAILQQLDLYLAEPGALDGDRLATQWRARSADIGAPVTLVADGQTYTGRIVHVDPGNSLMLQLDSGGCREFDAATTIRL